MNEQLGSGQLAPLPPSAGSAPLATVKIGGLDCLLELGALSMPALEELIRETRQAHADPGMRLCAYARHFLRTPFRYESELPIPARGVLRLRLQSFDCTTFVYTLLALCAARDLSDFAGRLRRVRYLGEQVDSDPERGTILDFACEALLVAAVQNGLLANVTETLCPPSSCLHLQLPLRPFARPGYADPERRVVAPKLCEGIAARFVDAQQFKQVTGIRSGDILLLTRGERDQTGNLRPSLVSHLVIASQEQGQLHFLHATKHFAWRAQATRDSPAEFSGQFLGRDPRREQIGVGYGLRYAGDEVTYVENGEPYYGYLPGQKREFPDYVKLFVGTAVLRPLGQETSP
jgi:hypothetical protein